MPVDRSAIDAQLRGIGEGDRWWEHREFRELPYILHDDERIRGIANGKLFGPPRPRVLPSAHWLIIATTHRLICLKRQRVGRQQMDIHLGQIVRMQHRNGVRGVRLTLETTQRRYRIRLSKADAFRFIGALAPLVPQALTLADADLPNKLLSPGSAPAEGGSLRSRFSPRAIPAGGTVTREDYVRLASTVERLESDMERMRQHVEFLENLLHKQAEGAYSVPGRSSES